MSRDGSVIAMRQSSTLETEPGEIISGHDDTEQEGSRSARGTPLISNKQRASVLLGSAILQFPIWGFAMSYGVLQEYFSANWTLQGNREETGIIGTTFNGVMYLSIPFLFGLFTGRWAHIRHIATLCGLVITCISFLLSSFSTNVWHLIATQGVAAALGCALVYSPATLSLGEWFNDSNRALAYALVLSSKNVVGSIYPFIFRALLDNYGFRVTMRIITAMVAGTAVLGLLLIPTHPSNINSDVRRTRGIPWRFLKHRTIYVYSFAIMLQSCGYGIPPTYLNTYAQEISMLSQSSATLLLTLFNVPGIIASFGLGYVTSNKHFTLSAATVTCISAMSAALATFVFWGLSSQGSFALLILFSMTFGFFAGGYSATWGRIINEMEEEASKHNEAVDSGFLYGLLNGARGIGYVIGGLAGVSLLKDGSSISLGNFAYGTSYGPLILFTGLSSAFGGWSLLWKCDWRRLLHLV